MEKLHFKKFSLGSLFHMPLEYLPHRLYAPGEIIWQNFSKAASVALQVSIEPHLCSRSNHLLSNYRLPRSSSYCLFFPYIPLFLIQTILLICFCRISSYPSSNSLRLLHRRSSDILLLCKFHLDLCANKCW